MLYATIYSAEHFSLIKITLVMQSVIGVSKGKKNRDSH